MLPGRNRNETRPHMAHLASPGIRRLESLYTLCVPGAGLMILESPNQQQGLDDFTTLYVGHYEQLLRMAVLLVGDMAAAEDVVQEAFIRVHHALDRRPVHSPLAYLRQTVVNLARSELRRRLIRLRHAPRPAPPAASAEEGACASIARQEVIQVLRRSARGRDRGADGGKHRRGQELYLSRHGKARTAA